MNLPEYPLREVKSFRFLTTRYNRPGEGSTEFTLACGHKVFSKQSDGLPRRKRCRQCWVSGPKDSTYEPMGQK